ncbi:hypothetical protein B0T26DRAFT_736386 [Lasiosphaeria miniovina]|uniref:Uncharacterized protein n=1 Tax=Lasiosphaeria miniovina TaxID=1954250 RepID=A0AA40BFU2_9PEZI|nr:uncharacterized protein B0T26DRAFT_736386 [Lasiosphaeria miniovina]KAK0733452.1 hypothetical protein B0T26DRAFT_736386 [Lasiosphaeria miniovina]
MFLSDDQQQIASLGLETNGSGSHTDGHHQLTLTSGPSIPPHPLRIKPLGNKFFDNSNDARESLGSLQVLPDEMLMQLLEYFDKRSLRLFGYTCKFLFAHCMSDDVWKYIFLESELGKQSSFTWLGSWRATVLGLTLERRIQVDCSNVFSDVLHRPFVCSHIALHDHTANIPAKNQIDRFEDLSYAEFADKWSSKPFILTKHIQSWPAYQSWNLGSLLDRYSNVNFRAEAVDWSFATYYRYMLDSQDESPLYLFDRKFAEKMDIEVSKGGGAAYWKPDCFGPDLFELLGTARPAHRWLIIGPARSGSTFHKDPNATSAWNAVIQGAKYWIMFPPTTAVPGVYVSKDNSEVTSPLSIAEWLLEFQAEARKLPDCREGICNAGEILHVPSGWWHLVVNLEAGIALTQNFVPKSHLPDVLSFLKDRPDQVSGFKKEVTEPYSIFVAGLREKYPDLLEEALGKLAEKQVHKKRRWDFAAGDDGAEEQPQKKSAGFSFGFGFGDDG